MLGRRRNYILDLPAQLLVPADGKHMMPRYPAPLPLAVDAGQGTPSGDPALSFGRSSTPQHSYRRTHHVSGLVTWQEHGNYRQCSINYFTNKVGKTRSTKNAFRKIVVKIDSNFSEFWGTKSNFDWIYRAQLRETLLNICLQHVAKGVMHRPNLTLSALIKPKFATGKKPD